MQRRRKAYAARFTNVALLGSIMPKRPGWRRHVAFGVLALGLATLVVSLAVPSTVVRVPREKATVVMAVDVSLSMQATDIEPDRFRAMQTAAKEFVDVLPERINLGLVSFAGTATTVVPPTTDRPQVANAIDNLDLAESTAIGEAIFTSLTAIENFQSTVETRGEEPPPARIVLLSDGSNTVGRENTQAIDAARAAGVPVSTIAFGTDYGTLDLDGEIVPVPVDRAALEKIADETGGSYSEAVSAAELEQVYADLGSQIGYTDEPKDVSAWFVRAGRARRPARRRPQPALDQPPRLSVAQREGSRTSLPVVRRASRSWCASRTFGQRVAPADDRLQRALGHHRQQLVHRGVHHLRPGHAVRQPEADDGAALLHERGRRGPASAGLAAGHAVGDQPAERGQRRQRAVEHVAAGHLQHDVDRLAAVGLAQGAGELLRVVARPAPGRRWRAAPSSSASARFSGLEAVAMTRPAPQRRASWTARLPTPPAPAMTTTDSPSARCELVRSRCHAVAPWRTTASACSSLTPSGTGQVRKSCATTFSA